MLLFFQAEDGIRDLVRSRGLGDVYKRQVLGEHPGVCLPARRLEDVLVLLRELLPLLQVHVAVSYTHLTLPTSDLV